MKTRILIAITLLAFQFNFSYAANLTENSVNRPVTGATNCLAPSTPAFAEFSDLVPEPAASTVSLLPVTPKEADFDDEIITETVSNDMILRTLSPATPKEADFEDNIVQYDNVISLSPAIPAEAGFEDIL